MPASSVSSGSGQPTAPGFGSEHVIEPPYGRTAHGRGRPTSSRTGDAWPPTAWNIPAGVARLRTSTRRDPAMFRPGVAAGPVDGSSAADRHRSGGRLHPVRRHHDGHDRRVPGPRRPGRHPRQRALRCYRRLSVPAQHAHLGLDRPDRRPADGRSRLGGVLGPDVGRIVGISPSPPPTTRP